MARNDDDLMWMASTKLKLNECMPSIVVQKKACRYVMVGRNGKPIMWSPGYGRYAECHRIAKRIANKLKLEVRYED